mmetsp:Transcript_27128/g.27514  ORF Transcript_27128/g.27514 Transcript_27128/m.27514 type:complete len:103 (-) Transcript_27128:351-659(-)
MSGRMLGDTHRAEMANAIPDGATVYMLCDFDRMVSFVEGAEHGAGEMYLDEVPGRSMIEEIYLGGEPEDFDGNRMAVLSLDRRPITSLVQKEEGLKNKRLLI